ncbi:hypothetical protein KEM60_01255 [Austwickia sp. TVS 96-490-7B]|uniref:AAA family ATPase n=1 Tax=Austwickia sp. TVS 96-490-7B TaxID=2830843 RepID=UPI001C594220|nr:AAA family ATPase [Austwickia sp. TVS 96-490-7B]MBW3085063.1 hypothetical protein [Austwickia sp. TVS 96-490-7B]
MQQPVCLTAMMGLPGAGKTTVARAMAQRDQSVLISVDPIEDAMHRAGIPASHETGLAAYLIAEVIARESLMTGLNVIVDAANYVEPARHMWQALATECAAVLTWVEVVCSDESLHRRRLAARDRGFGPTLEIGWADVTARRDATDPWPAGEPVRHVSIDTACAIEPQLNTRMCGEPFRHRARDPNPSVNRPNTASTMHP